MVACRILPRRLLYVISDHLTSPLVHACVPVLRRSLAANLRHVDPAVTPLRVLRSYSRNLLDTVFASLPQRGAGSWSFEEDRAGDERFRRGLAAGRGLIVVSPHLGNWDIGCRSLAQRGFRFFVVAQPEPDPTIEDFRRRTRHDDSDVTIRAGSAMESFFRVRSELERGGMVLMLGDRARPGDGVEVTFFGRRTLFPRTPAAMSHLTGAPIAPAAFVRCGDGRFRGLSSEPLFPVPGPGDSLPGEGPAPSLRHRAGRGPSLEGGGPPADHSAIEAARLAGEASIEAGRLAGQAAIEATTQSIARAFEGFVREYPEQWFNFYPFWETDSG